MRRIASSDSTPITESCGPVMPASVMNAVPCGRTYASEVWTCVGPDDGRHAPVEPAGERDLLARRLGVDVDEDERVSRVAVPTRSSITSNITVAGWRNSDPSTLTTARRAPFAVGTTVIPRPGAERETLAGRTTWSELSRYSPISVRRKAWFPSVTASAPAAGACRRGAA